jgi:hypothetical protein
MDIDEIDRRFAAVESRLDFIDRLMTATPRAMVSRCCVILDRKSACCHRWDVRGWKTHRSTGIAAVGNNRISVEGISL